MDAPLEEALVVGIGGRSFAFPIDCLREVLPMVEPLPVPAWGADALGAIDVRGELVPLLDVGPSLGLPEGPLSPAQLVLVLLVEQRPWAIVVDAVEGVRAGSRRALSPSGQVWSTPAGESVLLDASGVVSSARGGIR